MELVLKSLEKCMCSFAGTLLGEIVPSIRSQKETGVKETYRKYEDLLKVLNELALKHNKLDIEIKSYIRRVRKRARTKIKIIEEAERQLNEGKDISDFIASAEGSNPQEGFEELWKKYDALFDEVNDCSSEATKSCVWNKHSAESAKQIDTIVRFGATGILGYVGGSVLPVKLAGIGVVLSNPAALSAVCVLCGSAVGYIIGDWFFAIEKPYREREKELKKLHESSRRIIEILSKKYEFLTEIRQLLDDLKTPDAFNTVRQDENSHTEDSCQRTEGDGEDTNIGFLDSTKETYKELKKKCDDFLNYDPLIVCVGFLPTVPLGSECKKYN